jgi:Trypsin
MRLHHPYSVSAFQRMTILVLILLYSEFTCRLLPPAMAAQHPSPVERHDYPWLARLEEGGRELCTASIISPRHLLTAAHCILDTKIYYHFMAGMVEAVAGPSLNSSVRQRVNPWLVYTHPRYRSYFCDEYPDLAVVELAEPLLLGVINGSQPGPTGSATTLQAIPLASSAWERRHVNSTHGKYRPLMDVSYAGWGSIYNTNISTQSLKESHLVKLVDKSRQNPLLRRVVEKMDGCERGFTNWGCRAGLVVCTHFIAGDRLWYGDSGGPLMVRADEIWPWLEKEPEQQYLIGVYSGTHVQSGEGMTKDV